MTVSQRVTPRPPRRVIRRTLAAAGIAAALGGSYLFVEMNQPAPSERWRWVIGVAGVLMAGVLVFRLDHRRSVLGAPLIGLVLGMAVTVILGAIAASVDWLASAGLSAGFLRSAVLDSLPLAALVGALIGLLGWWALRLVLGPATASHRQPSSRVQFGFRALLFGVFAAAGLTWIVTPLEEKYQQQRAIDRLIEIGGRVEINGHPTGVSLNEAPTDADLEALDHLPHLRSLGLDCSHVTRRGLAHLQGLQSLQSLRISHAGMDDLHVLRSLPGLTLLSLGHMHVDQAAVDEIAQLPKLEWLALYEVKITDADFKRLAQAPALRRLQLMATNVTDAGLAHLAASPSLTTVWVLGTDATNAGAQRLATALQARDEKALVFWQAWP
jgi:hypothetical protein